MNGGRLSQLWKAQWGPDAGQMRSVAEHRALHSAAALCCLRATTLMMALTVLFLMLRCFTGAWVSAAMRSASAAAPVRAAVRSPAPPSC